MPRGILRATTTDHPRIHRKKRTTQLLIKVKNRKSFSILIVFDFLIPRNFHFNFQGVESFFEHPMNRKSETTCVQSLQIEMDYKKLMKI